MGIFFDFFDGLTARLLGVSSPLGKELDSLSDMVTSGVAPSFILMNILKTSHIGTWSYIALFIALFAANRLAKFNIDNRQSHSFLGLPTPANALFWVSMGLCFVMPERMAQISILQGVTALLISGTFSHCGVVCLIVMSLLLDILMVS